MFFLWFFVLFNVFFLGVVGWFFVCWFSWLVFAKVCCVVRSV